VISTPGLGIYASEWITAGVDDDSPTVPRLVITVNGSLVTTRHQKDDQEMITEASTKANAPRPSDLGFGARREGLEPNRQIRGRMLSV